MQTWLSIEEFSKLIGKDVKEIEKLCEDEKLVYKIEDDKIFIEASKGTQSLIPMKTELEIVDDLKEGTILEKTISTILTLHERVLEAKDETIESLKSENEFLKGSVISVQEIYDEDRKTIETLQKQLKIAQEELEFCRRKYKLMWGKVIKKETNDE
jgi:cupin superfamily acireductone dioxygenase involved in methionine salvage